MENNLNYSLRKSLKIGLLALAVAGLMPPKTNASNGTDYYHIHTEKYPTHWIATTPGGKHPPFIGGHNHLGTDGIFNRPNKADLQQIEDLQSRKDRKVEYPTYRPRRYFRGICNWPNTLNELSRIAVGESLDFVIEENQGTPLEGKIYRGVLDSVDYYDDYHFRPIISLDFKKYPEMRKYASFNFLIKVPERQSAPTQEATNELKKLSKSEDTTNPSKNGRYYLLFAGGIVAGALTYLLKKLQTKGDRVKNNVSGLVSILDKSSLEHSSSILYENSKTRTAVYNVQKSNFRANQKCGWTGDVCVWNSTLIATPLGYKMDNFHLLQGGNNPAIRFKEVIEEDNVITAIFNEGRYTFSANKSELTPFSSEEKSEGRKIMQKN